jgi:hypothetical protein
MTAIIKCLKHASIGLTLFLVFGVGLYFVWKSAPGSRIEAMKPGFVHDVYALRSSNDAPVIDISQVVLKYIPISTSQEDAVYYLTKLGFEIYFLPTKNDGMSHLFAKKNIGASLFDFVGSDSAHIGIDFSNGKIIKEGGQLVYIAL